MVWNHRVVKHETKREDGSVETLFMLHEAYYEKVGDEPYNITLEGVAACGETVEELRQDLERMLKAVMTPKMPVLNYEDY